MILIIQSEKRCDLFFYIFSLLSVFVVTFGLLGCGQAKEAAKEKIEENIEEAVSSSRLSTLEELVFTGGANRLVENLVAITQSSLSQGENANSDQGRLVATDNAELENCEYSVIQFSWTCSVANTTNTTFTTNLGTTINLSATYQGTVVIQFEGSDETKLPQSQQSAATINQAIITPAGTVTVTLTSDSLNEGQSFSMTLTLSETTITLTDIQDTQFNFSLQATATAQTSVGSQERSLSTTLTGSGQVSRASDSVTVTSGDFTFIVPVGEDTYSFQMTIIDGVSSITVSLNGEEQSSHEFVK